MSNKQQLQTNNTNLDTLIARVNAAKDTAASLPEAGGATLESCTVTRTGSAASFIVGMSIDAGVAVPTEFHPLEPSLSVIKDSLLTVTVSSPRNTVTCSGNATIFASYATVYILRITGDATITIS